MNVTEATVPNETLLRFAAFAGVLTAVAMRGLLAPRISRRAAAGDGLNASRTPMTYSNPTAYEEYMGRWSARLAPSFLRFAAIEDGQDVLDVGCGTGSLARAVHVLAPNATVTGIDPVASFVAFARHAVSPGRAHFQIGGVEALPYSAHRFDATLALLVLQDLKEPAAAVNEMTRVTKVGGIVSTCLWDFEGGMPMFSLLWQAAEAVAPEAVARQREHNPAPRQTGLYELRSLWASCGLDNIQTTTLELAMEFSSFDDYWQPFLGGATPTSAFAAALDAETGGALVSRLRAKLPNVKPGEPFILPARAWAIKGVVPGCR